MTKRERVLAALSKAPCDQIPASFSLHFPTGARQGEAAIRAHLDFYEATDVDILKIMNENLYPEAPGLTLPEDWDGIPEYGLESAFLRAQLEIAEGIRARTGPEDYLLGTVHGVCASAIHPYEAAYGYEGARLLFRMHLRENRAVVMAALQRITDTLCTLARAYIGLGLDGIYYAQLGAEHRFFTEEEFQSCIAPFDLQILRAAREAGGHTFLHICKDRLDMRRLADYAPYCDAVNWGVFEAPMTLPEGAKLFPDCAVLGGLSNVEGAFQAAGEARARELVEGVVRAHGREGLLVGADCTLPPETPYRRIRAVTDAVHSL